MLETILDEPRAEASTRLAVGLLLAGIAFDTAAHSRFPSIASTAFVVLIAAALGAVVRDRTRRVALGCAAVLACFLALRASSTVALLDLAAICVMLVCASSDRLGDLAGMTIHGALGAAFGFVGHALAAPAFVLKPVFPMLRRLGGVRTGRTLRTVAVAVPIIAIFAALLAGADRIFADVITPALPDVPFGSAIGHVILVALGTWSAAALWRSAVAPHLPGGSDAAARRPALEVSEWTAVLAGVDLLFAVFVVVQLAFLFGGRARVEVTPGLTYAEYARSGFFQLLAVAILTEIVIVGAWDLGRRPNAASLRLFRALVGTMVGLSFVIVASAMMRLKIYEDTFGFTINRLVAMIAIAVIGAVLAATMILIVIERRERLLATVMACGFAGLLAFNTVNPDRFVARHNVERFRATGSVDVAYLSRTLGPDAIPVTVTIVDELRGFDRTVLLGALCEARRDAADQGRRRDWNLGRARARSALLEAFDRGHVAGADCPAVHPTSARR